MNLNSGLCKSRVEFQFIGIRGMWQLLGQSSEFFRAVNVIAELIQAGAGGRQ